MRGRGFIATIVVAAFGLGACASSAENVGPAYVSPNKYAGYNCGGLAAEGRRVAGRVAQLSGVQNEKASNDAVATGVAIILFWPAAFLIGGNDQNTAELARLKGDIELIQRTSNSKGCGLRFQEQAAPEAPAAKKRPGKKAPAEA